MITLITVTQGNVNALKRTVDNVIEHFQGRVDEVIVGDLCVFKEDSEAINFVRTIPLPFNFLFEQGFGSTLNQIAAFAKNDLILYLNVGEIVEANMNIELLNQGYNCFQFNHATDPHKWTRLYNRRAMQWSGRIHEEVIGDKNLCPSLLFTMADTEKDSHDPFKAQVYNDIKELVYFNQYVKLVDSPAEKGATNEGWVNYAKDGYESLVSRLNAKGKRYEAFKEGDLQKYLDNCQEFENFENNNLIHYQ
jgi:uncharacterized protein YdbL (DUF1318 family)